MSDSDLKDSTAQPVEKPRQKFTGKVLDFNLGGISRKHISGVIKYGEFRKYCISNPFDSKTGEGEQRNVIVRHAKTIKKSMSTGKFSPTVFTLGTRKSHRDEVVYNGKEAILLVSEDNQIPVLDGGNRCFALEEIRDEGDATLRLVDNLPIPYILYLDGDTKEDFINLQAGKPVSRDHILSVRIANGLLDKKNGPYFEIGKQVAETLHETNDSFCKNMIQFDSRGAKLPLSLNGLCSKGGSSLGVSLIGGAKIAEQYKKDGTWLSDCILKAYRAIKDDTDLLVDGNVLYPLPSGNKSGTDLLIGIGNMLAARLWLTQKDEPDDDDLDLLTDCAISNMTVATRGNTSKDKKSKILHDFCVDFFRDLRVEESDEDNEELDVEKPPIGFHEEIPVILIELLSASAFDVSKLPSNKPKGRPKAVVSSAVVPEEDTDETEVKVKSSPDDPDFEEEDSKADELKAKLEADNVEDDSDQLDESNDDSTDNDEEAPWDETDGGF